MDGIDAVLAEFDPAGRLLGLRATHSHQYPPPLRTSLLELARREDGLSLRQLATLDAAVADHFAEAALGLLRSAGVEPTTVQAIGSHGQTVFHDTNAQPWSTLQLGDPSRIAARSGLVTVADFRRKDLALGGHGAPLLPVLHHALFADANEPRCVLNLGGIGNVTLLPDADAARVRGFDTGPANGLMNEWAERHLNHHYDADGAYAASGRCHQPLLAALLADPYFSRPPPKSTGRGYFHLPWLERRFAGLHDLPPADVQATLAELTARSVADSIHRYAPQTRRVLGCGGGVHNSYLMGRLRAALPGMTLQTTDDYGLKADWVEATAFAWLALRTLEGLPGNLPSVTGASRPAVLGGIYKP